MKSEHYLINRITFEDDSTPEKRPRKCPRLSVVGNIGFDMFTINYIDGFHAKEKFLLVDNPASEMDSYIFWSWMWDSGCKVIVRFDQKSKRHHWLNKDEYTVGEFIIRKEIIVDKHYTQLELTVNNLMERKSRKISHYQYHEFPDRNARFNSRQFKNFLKMINKKQERYCETVVEGKKNTYPIVVHSVKCFERAVTICALDICFDQLQKAKSVAVPNVLLKIKSQVSFDSFSLEEYMFLNRILLDSIRGSNLKEEKPKDSPESPSFRQRVIKYCLLFKRASVP